MLPCICITVYPYVEITDTHYRQGNILVSSFDEEIPVSGKIVDIIMTKFSECLFRILELIFTYVHCNAFDVHADTTHCIIYQQRDLTDYHQVNHMLIH